MMPITSGIRVAIKVVSGMLASPAVPIAIIVKKGPSFNERIEIAPASVASPYFSARARYSPPAELVNAQIIAIGVIPKSPAEPQTALTRSPSATPNANLINVRTTPLYKGIPIFRTSIFAPFSKRNSPRRQFVPVLNIPVVNPPTSRACGAMVFTMIPIKSGTRMIPPGTFCMSLNKLFLFSFFISFLLVFLSSWIPLITRFPFGLVNIGCRILDPICILL